MFQDDTLLVFRAPAQVVGTLDTLRSLGVDRIRVSVYWSIIAPSPTAPANPSFDAADPSSYPQAGWQRYDLIDRLATERGIAVNWDLVPPTPAWANTATSDPAFSGHYYPNPREYAQWVQAVGLRYSGSYVPPADAGAGSGSGSSAGGGSPQINGGPLPRVSFWSLWNEPNQHDFLGPQWGVAGSRVIEPAGPIYRSLVDRGYAGLVASGHGGDTILIGEMAPGGTSYPLPGGSLKPLRFLRALYCVGLDLRPLRGAAARALNCPTSNQVHRFPAEHPALFRATGIGDHPYSLLKPPGLRSTIHDDVTLADLDRLTTMLRTVFRAYGTRRAGLPIYVTEYGYQSRPPDPFGFPPAVQAAYLNQAEFQTYSNQQIRAYAQFLLVDDHPLTQFPRNSPSYWSTFQTGLIALNGRHKAAFDAFRLPIYLPVTRARRAGRFRVWGDLRPAPNGSRQVGVVQFRPANRSRWSRIAHLGTSNLRNYVDGSVRIARSGFVRLGWHDPRAGWIYSRAVAVTVGRG
jgi:hypothetical protein